MAVRKPLVSIGGRTKELPSGDTVSSDRISEGSNLFHTAARVRAVVLTGLSTATAAAIAATDSVLVALGKLQAQISQKANTSSLGPFATMAAGATDKLVRADGSQTDTLTSAGNMTFQLNAANSNVADIRFLTGNSLRWVLRRHLDTESGGNNGSTFRLSAYGDSGAGDPLGDVLIFVRASRAVLPGTDNAQNFGAGSFRWAQLFAANATINTSDAREKTELRALSNAELAAAREIAGTIGIYQWLASIDAKGETARLHVGVIAQQVASIFASHGLDAERYGLFCYDEWDERADPAVYDDVLDETGKPTGDQVLLREGCVHPAGNRYGICYAQLSMFLTAAQEQRLRALETA